MQPKSAGPGGAHFLKNHSTVSNEQHKRLFNLWLWQWLCVSNWSGKKLNCGFLPQGTTTSHGGARRFLCGWVGSGDGPSSSCCIVSVLLEEKSQVEVALFLYNL